MKEKNHIQKQLAFSAYQNPGQLALANLHIAKSEILGVIYPELLKYSFICPQGVRKIADYAFYGCVHVKSIFLSDEVVEIAPNAFGFCINMTHITLPKYLEIIDWNTFTHCSHLVSVQIPQGTQHIKDFAFLNCSNLTYITLPSGLKHIDDLAFKGCEAIKSIFIAHGSNQDVERIRSLLPHSLQNKVESAKSYFVNWRLNVQEALKSQGLKKTVSDRICNKALSFEFFKKAAVSAVISQTKEVQPTYNIF